MNRADLVYQLRLSAPSTANCKDCCYGETMEAAAAEIERLRAAVRWALGEAPDDKGTHFGEAEPPLEAKYWWRTTLRRMTGMGDLAYDKSSRTIIDRGNQQQPEGKS